MRVILQAINDKLYYIDDDGACHELCEKVYIKNKRINLISDNIILDVVIIVNGEQVEFQIERGELSKTIPAIFFSKGLTLLPVQENINQLMDFILDSDKAAPIEYYHEKLGFQMLNGKRIFLADTPVGLGSQGRGLSKYSVPTVTEQKGSLEDWLSIVHNNVLGRVNMELALAIGFSAPIAYLLREQGVYAEIPIWALIGESSTGKTTALRVIASIYGSPEESKGLIKDLNATENAFFKTLCDASGLPLIIDEATVKPDWDFATIIYSLSKGQEKAKCLSNGDLRKRLSFSGSIIISGENSLFEQSTPNLGMFARMAELNLPWTDNATHASYLSTALRQNYGSAVYPWMESVLNLADREPEKIKCLFEDELSELKELSPDITNVDERINNMYATVMASAILAGSVMDIKFNIKKLRRLLVDQHSKIRSNHDPAERLYNIIIDEAVRHGAKFPYKSNEGKGDMFSRDIWGEYDTRDFFPCLWITGETFKQFACKNNISNYKQLLKSLHEKGMIVKFSGDRYLSRHALRNRTTKCYCLLLSAQYRSSNPRAVKKNKRR